MSIIAFCVFCVKSLSEAISDGVVFASQTVSMRRHPGDGESCYIDAFQSQIGAIRSDALRNIETFAYSLFQSQIGAIRRRPGYYYYELQYKFQSQIGAIRREKYLGAMEVIAKFQSQIGAIRRKLRSGETRCNSWFQSQIGAIRSCYGR